MFGATPGRIHVTYDVAMTNTAPATATRIISGGVTVVRLVASQDCRVDYRAGHAPVANGTTPSGMFLPAGYVEIIQVSPGETVSCICDTATTGNLNVTEITR